MDNSQTTDTWPASQFVDRFPINPRSPEFSELCLDVLRELSIPNEEAVFTEMYVQTRYAEEDELITFEAFNDWVRRLYEEGGTTPLNQVTEELMRGPWREKREAIHEALCTPAQDWDRVFDLYGRGSSALNIGKGQSNHYRIAFMPDKEFEDPSASNAWLAPNTVDGATPYMLHIAGEALPRAYFLLGNTVPCFFGVQLGFLQYCADPDTDEWAMSEMVCALGGFNDSTDFKGLFLINPSALDGHHVNMSHSKHEIINGDASAAFGDQATGYFGMSDEQKELLKDCLDEIIRSDLGMGNATFAMLAENLDSADGDDTISVKDAVQGRMMVYRVYYSEEKGKLDTPRLVG